MVACCLISITIWYLLVYKFSAGWVIYNCLEEKGANKVISKKSIYDYWSKLNFVYLPMQHQEYCESIE